MLGGGVIIIDLHKRQTFSYLDWDFLYLEYSPPQKKIIITLVLAKKKKNCAWFDNKLKKNHKET